MTYRNGWSVGTWMYSGAMVGHLDYVWVSHCFWTLMSNPLSGIQFRQTLFTEHLFTETQSRTLKQAAVAGKNSLLMGRNFDLDVREEERVKYCWDRKRRKTLMSFMQIKLTPDY